MAFSDFSPYPILTRGPSCADCGASVDVVDLQYDPEAERWYCADDTEGCGARKLARALRIEHIRTSFGLPPHMAYMDPTDQGRPERPASSSSPSAEGSH